MIVRKCPKISEIFILGLNHHVFLTALIPILFGPGHVLVAWQSLRKFSLILRCL